MAASDLTPRPHQEMEERVRALLAEQRYHEACTAVEHELGPQLRGYLRGVIGNPQDGDDLYQDACVALVKRLPSFEGRSSLRTWWFAVGHYLVWKRLDRYSRRHGVVRLDTEHQLKVMAPSVSSLLKQVANQQKMAAMVEQLSPDDRELIILYTERGFKFRQIGEILQISEDAAKTRFSRLRARLRQQAAEE